MIKQAWESRVPWSDKEDVILEELYLKATPAQWESLLPGRTRPSIIQRIKKLGLQRKAPLSVIGHLSECERAYLAAIIDGEGCLFFERVQRSPRYSPVYSMKVSIATTSTNLLDWLEERIPGTVKSVVRVQASHKERYEWTVGSTWMSLAFLRELRPYLVIKAEQADLLLGGYLHLPEEQRYALYLEVRAAKRRA